MRIIVNGLSAGTGGGVTVARQITTHLANADRNDLIELTLISGHSMQEELREINWAPNVQLNWAPVETIGIRKRNHYEKTVLADRARAHHFEAAVNLNGMMIPHFPIPTLAHYQDPFPYRREAWSTWRHRAVAFFKRRAHRRSLKDAAMCGWTSEYLSSLVTGWHGITPKRSKVFYNGVPDSWLQREHSTTQPLNERSLILTTVGNVFPYKRQDLIIRAVARLRQEPQLSDLRYNILGAVSPDYKIELEQLSRQLGVGDAIAVEGRVSENRIMEALSQSRVMPLMSVCESFGIPAIEAMTFGTPVLVSNSCALPEVVADAAKVCAEDDLESLVTQLRLLLTDLDEANQMRQLGFQRAADFSWAKTAALMSESLHQLKDASE